MATKPINTKLWNMIVAQAKAKYSNYPNPGASHWVHSQYEKHGGKFVTITADDRKRMRLSKQFQEKRHEQAKKNREKNEKNKDD
jgi:Spy/CpxP family protein refolding chaperone